MVEWSSTDSTGRRRKVAAAPSDKQENTMSTRAGIGIKIHDGRVLAIYQHCDGYPKGGIGEALVAEFTRREDVGRLILEGIERPVDMGDKSTFPEQASDYFGADYAYLFEDGRWLVCEIHISSHSEWRELTEVLKET